MSASATRRPNFFIIGAPKSGTTSLYTYLSAHPRIFMSKVKEPHYFADDFEHPSYVRRLDDYLALFSEARDQHIAIGEASVHYLYSDCAIGNIYRFNPEARLIAMFRNPVDFVQSLHSQKLYNHFEDVPDLEEAWALQETRRNGERIPPKCTMPTHLQYRQIGSFGRQVQRLLEVFPREQILFVRFDDFKADTRSVYETVLRFLSVPTDQRDSFELANPNKIIRSPFLSRLQKSTPVRVFAERGKRLLGVRSTGLGSLLLRLNTKLAPRPPIREAFREQLVAEYREDVELLERLLDWDLGSWKQ